jgi:hypothetical protein
MIVRALSSIGDWTYGAGKNNYLSANAAVAQAIATRLQSFLGDCFFATDAGIDWFTFLGGSKNQLALHLAISAVILNTQTNGMSVVTGITTLSVILNDMTRNFVITYSATTVFGNVEGVVNQNLGVGPLAPPVSTPLLPQFNQTLLNNATATAVTGAMFNPVAFWEVDLEYFIERRTSTQSFVQRGTLVCKYDPRTASWSVDDFVLGGSSGPITGVAFTIDPSTGQVFYASDNMTGSSYVGNLIIQSLETFVAGL